MRALPNLVLIAAVACGASVALAASPVAVTLTAADGVKIRGDLYSLADDGEKTAPVILLFHQAGSNRGEYAEIAPKLNALGFHALAIDQRSGATRWGIDNETVEGLGKSTDFLAALPDLEAALAWKVESGYSGPTVVLGSSYSSSLVFLLAAKHDGIDAVLSFSPGEYLGNRRNEVRTAAKQVTVPVLVMTPEDERKRAAQIVEVIPGENHRFIVPKQAVHGASMLIPERNPGAAAVWPEVVSFLEPFR